MNIFLTSVVVVVVVVCNDGVPQRLSNVLITGIPFNDSSLKNLKHRTLWTFKHKHNH